MTDLTSQVTGWTKRQGKAGVRGLELVSVCIDHMFKSGDWTPLAWLITGLEGNDSSTIRRIVNECVGGIRMVRDAKQPSGLRIIRGDNAGPSEKMPLLRGLIEHKVSFRSKDVREVLFEKVESEFDLDKWALTLARRMNKEHVTQARLDNAIKAALKDLKAKAA